MIGHVKECHQPHNELCPHNVDPRFDCNCKSDRTRSRKAFRRVLVHDDTVDRGYSPDIVIEIYQQSGTLAFREKRRRKRYMVSTSDILSWLVRRAALAAIHEKRKKRTKNRR